MSASAFAPNKLQAIIEDAWARDLSPEQAVAEAQHMGFTLSHTDAADGIAEVEAQYGRYIDQQCACAACVSL